MAKITTSLKIDREVYAKFKIECIMRGLEFGEGIEQAINKWSKK